MKILDNVKGLWYFYTKKAFPVAILQVANREEVRCPCRESNPDEVYTPRPSKERMSTNSNTGAERTEGEGINRLLVSSPYLFNPTYSHVQFLCF